MPLVGLGKLWLTGPPTPQQGPDPSELGATMVIPRSDYHVGRTPYPFFIQKKKKNYPM